MAFDGIIADYRQIAWDAPDSLVTVNLDNAERQSDGSGATCEFRANMSNVGKGHVTIYLLSSVGELIGKHAYGGQLGSQDSVLQFKTGGTQTFTDQSTYADYDPADDEAMTLVLMVSGKFSGFNWQFKTGATVHSNNYANGKGYVELTLPIVSGTLN